jgi:hypothetical protein
MPWYAKLIFSLSMSLAVIGGTVAAVRGDRAWSGRTLLWATAVLLLAAGMAALTYYYHLHEEDEGLQDGDSVALVVEAGDLGSCA